MDADFWLFFSQNNLILVNHVCFVCLGYIWLEMNVCFLSVGV